VAELSPAAQAVMDAIESQDGESDVAVAVAALRVAVDQVAKTDPLDDTVEDCIRGAEREHMRGRFYTLATELESY
jgi:DNA-binding FrmR family transcriptional regulator